MKIGTKTLLYGYHAAWLHPFFVAEGWRRLYGFPWDPRLWAAFFVHDLGYWGRPNMDGPEGKAHPFLGAWLMCLLFDKGHLEGKWYHCLAGNWYWMSLLHSRDMAKTFGREPSMLCWADKLAFRLYPRWLLMTMYWLTGEGEDYYNNPWAMENISADKRTFEHWYPAVMEDNQKDIQGANPQWK